MRNHNITRGSILALLLFVFSFTQAQLVITPNVTPVCHSNDGAVTFSLTGGTSGHNFYLQATSGTNYPTQTSPTFTGLSAGLYRIYVYGSVDSGTLLFNIPNKIGVSATDIATTCPLNAGSITAAGSGGSSPYTYLWSTGATTSGISGLGGGPYTVTVTDASGCSARFDTSITATSPMSVSISNNGIVCNPTLTATTVGGTGTVTYHWSNSASTAAVSNLGNSGSYIVTVTDANGCTAIASTGINITGLYIDSSTSTITYPGCNGSLGSIAPVLNNGTAPYTYSWSTGASTPIITGLVVGKTKSFDLAILFAGGSLLVGLASYLILLRESDIQKFQSRFSVG